MPTRGAEARKVSARGAARPVTVMVNEDAPETVYLIIEDHFSGRNTQYAIRRAEWEELMTRPAEAMP